MSQLGRHFSRPNDEAGATAFHQHPYLHHRYGLNGAIGTISIFARNLNAQVDT